ncbi:MAG: isomerase [Chloroflexi bacterium HGW-Chloroflexi-10]|nr:MAG: isomerase [Chloroflexi bacterium HGW-Chloroflexi-10]
MKIDKIECTILDYPLPVPLKPSWAPGRTFKTTSCLLVRVTTEDGITGIGAGPDCGRAGLYTIADLLAPYLLGKDVFCIEQISPIIRQAAKDGSYPWSVEMALWDIIGKAANQPVYRLWGAFQDTLPVYASLAEVVPVEEQIQRLYMLKEMGFGAVKLRLRRPDINDDIRVVQQIRAEFGDTLKLMVDANQAHVMPCPNPIGAWNYEDALKVAEAMYELDVLWLEEPLPRYGLEQIARLTAATKIPIAGGELHKGLHEYKQIIDMNCYDIIQADAAFSEGIFQLRKVAALAELSYKRFIPHTWSNGIGMGANLHLAASLPNCPWFEFPIDPPAWTNESRDFMMAEPFHISKDGTITVSNKPGLGLELNEDAIRQYSRLIWSSDELKDWN